MVAPMSAESADGVIAKAKAAMDKATEAVKETARKTVSTAKDEGIKAAEMRREATASRVGGYGEALHASAEHFEEQDPHIASFVHGVAERIDGVAEYLRHSDLDTLREDAEGFARRNPAIFFGGLFALGLLLGNVAKASPLEDEALAPAPRGDDEGAAEPS